VAGDGEDATDSFGDTGFFDDEEGLDVAGFGDVTVPRSSIVSHQRRRKKRGGNDKKKTHVPPQNSTLVCLHFGFSISL
jgi:hypothetical protein